MSYSKPRFRRLFFAAIFLLPGAHVLSAADLKVLPGHVPGVVSKLVAKGRLSATNQLWLAVGVPMRDRAGLDNFVSQVSDPASPNFRHFLTREQVTERFGPTEQDYENVKAFAQTNGLTIAATHSNRLLLDVTGPVSAIENAFHITLRTYQHPTEAREFFAPDSEPMVEATLPVSDVLGLSNFSPPRPRFTQNVVANGANGTGTSGSLLGDDFRKAYVPGTTLTGAGQTVGLLEFDGYFASDISSYATKAGGGRTNIVIQTVLLDGYGGKPSTGVNGGETEVELDIEIAMAIAPGLSKIVSFEAGESGNQNDILNAMLADSNILNLSCSWGWSGPSSTTDAIFQSMDAVGQTFYNASGDNGAFTAGSNSVNGVDNPAAYNSPSSNPYITQVGGTTLTLNASNQSWSSEIVWNWGTNSSGTFSSSGASSGGISSYYLIPWWQTNVSNLLARGGSTVYRNIPDVAGNADNVYEIYDKGRATGNIGGTSAAAPLWAGFTALVNQQLAANGKPGVGFINPALYVIGARANYASCFHDVISGNNAWAQSSNLFYAMTNYDLCTGLGSMNGTALINALAPPPAPAPHFLPLTRAAGGITISWNAVAGNSYQVQYNPDFRTTNWSNLGAPITASNSFVSVVQSFTNASRFYRVVLLAP